MSRLVEKIITCRFDDYQIGEEVYIVVGGYYAHTPMGFVPTVNDPTDYVDDFTMGEVVGLYSDGSYEIAYNNTNFGRSTITCRREYLLPKRFHRDYIDGKFDLV